MEAAEAVELMYEGYIRLSPDFRYTYLNRRAEVLLRHRRADILGKSFWEVFPDVVGTPMEAIYRQSMERREPTEFEAYYPPHRQWYRNRLLPTAEGGLVVFLLDITRSREAEARLRAMEEADLGDTVVSTLR